MQSTEVFTVADLYLAMRRIKRNVERVLLRRGLPRSADAAIALAIIRRRHGVAFRPRDIRELAEANASRFLWEATKKGYLHTNKKNKKARDVFFFTTKGDALVEAIERAF